nr:unnamed protein product [Digitaria exilis]
MAQRRRQCGFPSFPTMRWLAHLAAMALICAASTAAQPQPLPLPTATAAAPPGGAPSLPAPCPPAQATLAPCLAFFTSNSSSPPAACCAQIRAMFQSQAPCLCAAMASGPAAQLGGIGSALGQLLPTSCDLPANACSGTTTGAAAGPTAPTVAAAAPESGTNGVDDPAGTGAGGIKSVPGLLGSGAAADAAGYRGVFSAAAVVMSMLGVYLL